MNKTTEQKIITDIAVMKIQVAEMHKELMGNGKQGLVKEWATYKGSISAFKWVAGGSGLIGIIAFIIAII